MASVRKRTWNIGPDAKAAWVADYFDQHGKRHLKTFSTKKAADAFLVGARHEVREGTYTAANASITVAEAAEMWLRRAELNKLERATVKQYENHVTHHINPLLGRVKLSALTAPMIEKFAADLLSRSYSDDPKQKLSRAMAKKILSSLKGIIKEAQRQGQIAKNPAEPVTIKIPRRGTRKIHAGRDFPSKEEINGILRAVSGRWRPFVITAIFTGLRSSELRGLRWDDIDFDIKVIHVRQRADAWGKMGPPKSEAGERAIPMTPMVANALKEWKLECPKGDFRLVFPNGDGRPENHANIANRGFYPLQIAGKIGDKIGEDKEGRPILRAKYGMHTLRHFFASWLIEQKFSPKKVQELLGHSSIQMTFDVYGHLFPSLEDDHEKMAAGEIALVG